MVDGAIVFLVGRRIGCGFGGLLRGLMEAECIGVPCLSMATSAASVASTEEGARESAGREEVVPTRTSGAFGALERLDADRLALPSRMVSLILNAVIFILELWMENFVKLNWPSGLYE